jgi:hypothetical protein
MNRPRQILIIRHAEKTSVAPGIGLNARGFERAAALPSLFPVLFEPPHAIIAAAPTKRSNRSVETVTPLAQSLYLAIDARFAKDDVHVVALELLSDPAYHDKTVLVCWHHKSIPALAEALGAPNPPLWDERRFDRIWKIEFEEQRAALIDLPQRLLEGDS